jgi:hypothetical protein
MALESEIQHAGGGRIGRSMISFVGAALLTVHLMCCDVRKCRTAASISGRLVRGQSIGNPAMQALEFGPAHLHRDIFLTDGRIGDEIQFDRIPVQDRSAADRSVDEPPSHADTRCAMIERRPATGLPEVTAQDEVEKSGSRITRVQTER